MKFSLISALMHGLWLMDEGAALAYQPMVNRLVNGEHIDFKNFHAKSDADVLSIKPQAAFLTVGIVDPTMTALNKAPKGSVAVIPLHGVVMQDDFCGAPGMNTIQGWLQDADNNPNIVGSVIDMNSPGGSATGVDAFGKSIKNMNKPVVCYVNYMAASGGYWIASSCNQIVVAEPLCMLGSIGAFSTFMDYSKQDEANGVREIQVYAPQSTKKNKIFRDIKEGNTDEYATRFLSPLVENFHATVKRNRRGNVGKMNADVFAGDIFNGTEAVNNGLADRIGSFKSAIQSVIELSKPKTA